MMAVDNILSEVISTLGRWPCDHSDSYSDIILSKMNEAGCTEFLVCPVNQSLQIVPLRMGYEADEIDWLYTSDEVSLLQIKRERINTFISCELISKFQRREQISRLPKLPNADRGAKVIEAAVTRVLTNRVLEAHEPPFPKNNPAFWPNWARYCLQGCHPMLGEWLKIAIDRHNSTNAA
jgi:hypothetical protein